MPEPRYDITAFGEVIVDLTDAGRDADGKRLFAQNAGGAPANVVVCAARLGARTAFLGKAGNDLHGKFMKDTLEKEGVDVSGLLLDANYFTTLTFVALKEDGERQFAFARKPGADQMIRPEELRADVWQHTRILHVGSLSVTDEPSRTTTHTLLKEAKKLGILISYDPNYRASLWPDEQTASAEMRAILPYADILKLSDEETALLTGIADPEKAAERLIDQGVFVVSVTLGARGAYVRCREGGAFVDGFHSRAIDSTGAGDSYGGAFLWKICQSQKTPDKLSLSDIASFARYANAVASINVERRGGIPAMPTPAEVSARLL